MLKRLLLCVSLAALLAAVGCMTTEPTIFSWPHHKRRIRTIFDDVHKVHMDIDRIVFDMEEYPIEVEY
jgi:hypothetical protein